jgi:hypothetical protein
MGAYAGNEPAPRIAISPKKTGLIQPVIIIENFANLFKVGLFVWCYFVPKRDTKRGKGNSQSLVFWHSGIFLL